MSERTFSRNVGCFLIVAGTCAPLLFDHLFLGGILTGIGLAFATLHSDTFLKREAELAAVLERVGVSCGTGDGIVA